MQRIGSVMLIVHLNAKDRKCDVDRAPKCHTSMHPQDQRLVSSVIQ